MTAMKYYKKITVDQNGYVLLIFVILIFCFYFNTWFALTIIRLTL